MANPLDKFIPDIEPSWMRPPLWRWREASEYLANPREPVPAGSDNYVKSAAYFLRARLGQRGVQLAREYPAFHLAHKLYGMASQFGGMRWQIEALMLAGFTDAQLAKLLPMKNELSTAVYRIYRKLFFDIDDYRDNQFAVLSNVFATSYGRNYDDSDVDLTWKMLAYELREEFPTMLRIMMGGRMTEQIQARIQEMTAARMLYAQHHFVNSMRMQYSEQALQLLNTAGQYWKLDERQVGQIRDQRLNSSCEKILMSVHLVITDSRMKMAAVEPLQTDVHVQALVDHFSTK